MNEKEIILTSKFLKMASEEFSNHGCNDVDNSFFEGWTQEEREQLVKDYLEYNGNPETFDKNYLWLPDWCLMSFLADKLLAHKPNYINKEVNK
jgi:hypothetical protein